VDVKLCRGPLHPPGGELVSLSEFTLNKSGPRKGKPLSRCRKCRNRGNAKSVSSEFFVPILDHLIANGVNDTSITSLYDRKRIYKKTFLSLKRQEAKLNNTTKIKKFKPKAKENGHKISKLSYEERQGLKTLISEKKKEIYLKDKKLLGSIVK